MYEVICVSCVQEWVAQPHSDITSTGTCWGSNKIQIVSEQNRVQHFRAYSSEYTLQFCRSVIYGHVPYHALHTVLWPVLTLNVYTVSAPITISSSMHMAGARNSHWTLAVSSKARMQKTWTYTLASCTSSCSRYTLLYNTTNVHVGRKSSTMYTGHMDLYLTLHA